MEKLKFFAIIFNDKNYLVGKFHFQLYVKRKDLWGRIDGMTKRPTNKTELAKWKKHDVPIMSWVVSSVEPHIVLNIRQYKIVADVWKYLKRIYNQDIVTRRFQLEFEIAQYTQRNKSIQDYYSGLLIYKHNILHWNMLM